MAQPPEAISIVYISLAWWLYGVCVHGLARKVIRPFIWRSSCFYERRKMRRIVVMKFDGALMPVVDSSCCFVKFEH